LIAFNLQLIDLSERKDLNVIRGIRNAFAHSANSVTFGHELIAAECAKFINFDPAVVADDPGFAPARTKFVDTAHTIYQRLMERVFESAEAFLDDLSSALDEIGAIAPGASKDSEEQS
jgi:hypothetical protein